MRSPPGVGSNTTVLRDSAQLQPEMNQSPPLYDDGLETVSPSTLETLQNNGHGQQEHAAYPSNRSMMTTSAPDVYDYHAHTNESYKAYTNYNPDIKRDNPRRTGVCGMPTSTFVLAIALIVVIVAAGVGGGIGGSLAVKNAKQSCATLEVGSSSSENSTEASTASSTPSSTPSSASNITATPTTTSSSVFTVSTNVVLPLDCPGLNNAPQSSTFGHSTITFQMFCGQFFAYSSSTEILSIIVYTLHDCLMACASLNHYGSANCTAVGFYANMTAVLPASEANCYMSSSTSVSLSDNSQGNYVVTGLLS